MNGVFIPNKVYDLKGVSLMIDPSANTYPFFPGSYQTRGLPLYVEKERVYILCQTYLNKQQETESIYSGSYGDIQVSNGYRVTSEAINNLPTMYLHSCTVEDFIKNAKLID